MRKLISVLGIVTLLLAAGGSASAWVRCDFLTGGGFIVRDSGAKANFGIGGSCRPGGDGHGLWGHLEYIDHGTGLNVHWTSITAYMEIDTQASSDKDPKRTGARWICGTARTNLYGDVDFAVYARDGGEPGVNDTFDIRLKKFGVVVYNTPNQCFPHYLGSYAPCSPGDGGGGNIQLHKPNPSTTGVFGGSCPAM